MKNFLKLLSLGLILGPLFAQAQNPVINTWDIHRGNEGVIAFVTKEHGDPAAYSKMSIPAPTDKGWSKAPVDEKGLVNFSETSKLKCNKELDFTYFQSYVNVPNNYKIETFNVSYDKADDGARIYIFNSKFPNGTFDEKTDLKLNKASHIGAVNLKDKLVPGMNRIVIVQFDDCAVHNNVKGIRLKFNGAEVPATANAPVPNTASPSPSEAPVTSNKINEIPTQFQLHAYSISGQRVTQGSNFWIGWEGSGLASGAKCKITNTQKGSIFQFEKIVLNQSQNIICLRVINSTINNLYLTVFSDYSVGVSQISNINSSKNCQFYVRNPQETDAAKLNFVSFESVQYTNYFLRHEHMNLKVTQATEEQKKYAIFRQDASWLFESAKVTSGSSSGGASASATAVNYLEVGSELKQDQEITSANKQYTLKFQKDGNLCVYKGSTFVWGTMTHQRGGVRCVLEKDGNFCMYNSSSQLVWATFTNRVESNYIGRKLVIENDGSLVIYNAQNKAIWKSCFSYL